MAGDNTGKSKEKKPQKRLPKRRAAPHSTSSVCWVVGCVLALAASVLVGLTYRYLYPLKQRCPAKDDRFYDHCMEGRKHYMIRIDWSCLGPRRSVAMRQAFDLPSDGGTAKGIGEVPSWLTASNAEAVRNAPCINALVEDTGCWYCKPTPKKSDVDEQIAQAKAAQARAARADEEAREQPQDVSAAPVRDFEKDLPLPAQPRR